MTNRYEDDKLVFEFFEIRTDLSPEVESVVNQISRLSDTWSKNTWYIDYTSSFEWQIGTGDISGSNNPVYLRLMLFLLTNAVFWLS